MFRKLLILTVAAVLMGACAAPATPTPTPTAVPPTATATVVPPTAPPTIEPSPTPIALTDGLGRAVTLAAPARRIITMAPSNTELLYAVGAGAQIAGRDEYSDYPAEAADIPSIGSVYGALNTEAIVSLDPDLVFAAEINSPEQVKTLEQLGITVYWLANPKDFDGLYENIAIVGQLTGHDAEAAALNQSLQSRVAAVESKVKLAASTPTVFYEVDASDPLKPWTAGSGTFMDALITMAGGKNVGATLAPSFAQVSSEALVTQNPDMIILGDALFGVTADSVAQRAGWDAIAAVKNKAIYAFDDNLASRPGPRLVDGLESLARLFHPELFK